MIFESFSSEDMIIVENHIKNNIRSFFNNDIPTIAERDYAIKHMQNDLPQTCRNLGVELPNNLNVNLFIDFRDGGFDNIKISWWFDNNEVLFYQRKSMKLEEQINELKEITNQ